MKILKTDQAQTYLREHDGDYDAQAVWQKLVAYSTASTKASLDSSALLSYITTACLSSDTWRGSSQPFILHWQEQVRWYGELNPAEKLSKTQQHILLQNAVHPVDELCAVKNQADQFKTQTGNALTFDEYLRLLTSAAISRDASAATKCPPPPCCHSVYQHQLAYDDAIDDNCYEVHTHDLDFADINESSFTMDESIDTIQAFATQQQCHPTHPPRP